MPHLVCEHDGNFILVCQIAVKPYVDAHVVSECAEGVKTVLSVDEIVVGAVVDTRVHRSDCRREIGKDAVKLTVQIPAIIHAVFFLELRKECLTPLLGCVVVLNLFVHFVCGDGTADDCTDDALRVCLGDRRCHNTSRHSCGKCECNAPMHPFLLVHISSSSHKDRESPSKYRSSMPSGYIIAEGLCFCL